MRCSVIVPVYENWHLVPKLLECMIQQTLPQDQFETILVNNGSKNFQPPDNLPANVQVKVCKTPGSYAARNHGIAHAKGQWLAFTDADCRPHRDWLETLMAHAEQPNKHPTTSQPANQSTGQPY